MKIRRRCKCGCGRITNPGNKYIYGHHFFGNTYRKGTGKTKIRRRCKCGCGQITNYGKRYVNGHHAKNPSEDTRRKLSIASMGNIRAKGQRSKEIRNKISLGLMGNTNASGYERDCSEETRKKLSLISIEKWQDPDYQKRQCKAQSIRPNKSETTLLKLLNKLFPNEYKYTGDFSFMINGKNPDFVNINGQKKIIELFGDYWHKGQDPQDRIDIFTPFGYKTLVIWENELKKSRLQLRRRLIGFHES